MAEGDEAAAVAEEGVGALGNVAEFEPKLGGAGVECGGFSAFACCFGELCAGQVVCHASLTRPITGTD
jgi:hypothetical protein